jgi:hypothetical protein
MSDHSRSATGGTIGLKDFIEVMSERMDKGEVFSLDEFTREASEYAAHHCDCGRPKKSWHGSCHECMMEAAGKAYDPERHDPESVFFDDSYTGPSEIELGGGCTRCGVPDDCYCNG